MHDDVGTEKRSAAERVYGSDDAGSGSSAPRRARWILRSIPAVVARIAALFLGLALIVQGVSTAGFVAIVGLFAGTVGQLLHVFALIGLGFGLVVLGGWLASAGLRNFPLLRSGIRRVRQSG